MLRKHSSEPIAKTTGLHNAPSVKEARVVLLANRRIAHENPARAARPALDKSGFTPGSDDCDRSGLPEDRAWSPVFTFLMEGFALYGASLHPTTAFPVDAFLAKEERYANLLSED
jgi:hypothetical protein